MKKLLYSLILLSLWAVLTVAYIFIYDESFTILSTNHEKVLAKYEAEYLLKGKKVSGEFKAERNNLGILAIRFRLRSRIPYRLEDELLFRIKEQNSNKWHYENVYRSGFTYDMPFLPFGFPVISDSEGKIYYFELISLHGNSENAVIISEKTPNLVSKYQKSKNEISANIGSIVAFLTEKTAYSMRTIDILYSSVVFALPFIFYLIWISPISSKYVEPFLKKLIKKTDSRLRISLGKRYRYYAIGVRFIATHGLIIILLMVLLVDTFFLQVQNDLLYIVIVCLLLALLMAYKLGAQYGFYIGMGFLIMSPLLLWGGYLETAERASVWALILFLVGIIHCLIDLRGSALQK